MLIFRKKYGARLTGRVTVQPSCRSGATRCQHAQLPGEKDLLGLLVDQRKEPRRVETPNRLIPPNCNPRRFVSPCQLRELPCDNGSL